MGFDYVKREELRRKQHILGLGELERYKQPTFHNSEDPAKPRTLREVFPEYFQEEKSGKQDGSGSQSGPKKRSRRKADSS